MREIIQFYFYTFTTLHLNFKSPNLPITSCNENPVLVETVLSTLNTGWKDECPRVRATCLVGGANVARLRGAHAARAQVLHAMSNGLDAGVGR